MADGSAPLVALDANVLDSLDPHRTDLARAFWRLLDQRHVRLMVPDGVADELRHAGVPAGLGLVLQSLLTATESRPRARPTARQQVDRIRVRAILRGDGRPGKHDRDASHLSEAAEAGCSVFVTADGKILRKRDTLALALPADLRILTLAEFVAATETDDLSSDIAW